MQRRCVAFTNEHLECWSASTTKGNVRKKISPLSDYVRDFVAASTCKQSHFINRYIFRYRAVLLRQRFEQNRNEVDPGKVQDLLEKGEQELFENQHPQPRACT